MTRNRLAPSELAARSFERILLIKPSSLGDVVHALPVLHGLRQRYPHAKINWLIATGLAPLLQGHPELDERLVFDRKTYGRMWRSASTARAFLQFVRQLRSRKYDLVIDLQGLFRTGFLSWVSRAPVRVGFRTAREGASNFYTHFLEIDDPDMHAVDRNFLVAQLLGFEDVPVQFDLAITQSERLDTEHLLMANGIDPHQPWLAVVPGARWETKQWPVQRFAAVIDEMNQQQGTPSVVLGGPDEIEICAQLLRACQSKPVNLAGRTSVRQFAALIGLASSVLCLDSASAHLAAAQNRKLVCISGPTNPKRTGPYRQLADVVRLDIPCSPCYFRKLRQCPNNHRCMAELSANEVSSAVRRSLGSRRTETVGTETSARMGDS